MIQNNYFSENPDQVLSFEKLVDWNEIVSVYENDYSDAKKYAETGEEVLSMAPGNLEEALDYYRSILDTMGEIAGNTIAQSSKEMDKIGLKFENGKVIFPDAMVKCFETVVEAGVLPFSSKRHHGGLSIPMTVQAFYMETAARGDASFAILLGTFGLSETVEKFASKEIVEEYVPRMNSGEFDGAMALTEPNFGSDLSNVQTRAEKQADGSYRLTGTKRFITHGVGFHDRPALILTLARTGGSGARGLSFFLVNSNDVEIISIESKLGLKCSPTCEVVYENAPAKIIGEEGLGLVRYSMAMMNTARLTIAGQALGIAQAAWSEAKKYASEREQFGKTIENIPAVRRMLDHMEREIIGMRLLLLESARTVDLYLWRTEQLQESGMDDKQVRKDETVRHWEKLANFFTPLAKYYLSEKSNQISYDGIQVFGGSGYTKDYDAERLFRDARITNIYEGTTQLQIVAAIGGIVSGMAGQGNLRLHMDEIMGGITPSSKFLEIRDEFEKIVSIYKEIHDSEKHDYHALDVVESAARTIISLLYERAISRLDGEEKDRFSRLAAEYQVETMAILKGNLYRVEQTDRL